MGEPWVQVNAYQLHDTSHWRDLNLKLVPLCWRDWKIVVQSEMKEEEAKIVLEYFYERAKFLVEQGILEWDATKGERMIIQNSGSADQTYDVWRMTGVR